MLLAAKKNCCLSRMKGGNARYASADITPCVPILMNNLFILPSSKFPESEENQYVMKCMMRVLGIADISNEIAGPCFSWFTSILNEIFLLLFPDSWKRSSNVPALVRLLEAFIQKAPHELNQEERLNQVLGIFNMLVSSSSTAKQGFYELNTVIENLEYGVISPYMNTFWKFLFMRLQKQSYCKVSEVSCDFHVTLFGQAWGSKFSGHNECSSGQDIVSCLGAVIECTLAAVASTRLVCESPVLLDAAAARHWGRMLDSIVTLVLWPEKDRAEEELEMPENVGYTATLVFTSRNIFISPI
ncbi:hypothetical protein GOBAR_DD13937 [Gossypium barbadense]|nr:hypothetical protein GOBAR_DD13937 [Gossypium barbadense]